MKNRTKRVSGRIIKVILIGDSGVGKTNLITRYTESYYKECFTPTIGVDFRIKQLILDQEEYKMQIWDTAGQERFSVMTKSYYKGANAVIICFSLNDRHSFENCGGKWLKQVKNSAPEEVNIILLGTKSDLVDERQVTTE